MNVVGLLYLNGKRRSQRHSSQSNQFIKHGDANAHVAVIHDRYLRSSIVQHRHLLNTVTTHATDNRLVVINSGIQYLCRRFRQTEIDKHACHRRNLIDITADMIVGKRQISTTLFISNPDTGQREIFMRCDYFCDRLPHTTRAENTNTEWLNEQRPL